MGVIRHYPDGFYGAASDDPLASAANVYHHVEPTTDVRFVHSGIGSNTTGQGTRDAPFATLAHALSLSGDGDVIYLMRGHSEVITAQITVGVRVLIIGEGRGNERPSLSFNQNDAGSPRYMLNVTAPCHIRNIRFVGVLSAHPHGGGAYVFASAAGARGTRISYCEFIGALSAGIHSVVMNVNGSVVDGCVFVSQATVADVTGRPLGALLDGYLVRNCTFDGGAYGWRQPSTIRWGWGNVARGPVGITGAATVSVVQCEMFDDAHFAAPSSVDYQVYPDGLGLVGHPVISGRGLYVSGDPTRLCYVHNVTGVNTATVPATPGVPRQTLAYALGAGGAVGLVVVRAGHEEDLAAIVPVANPTMIVGEGVGANRPRFRSTGGGIWLNHASGGILANCVMRAEGGVAHRAVVNANGALVEGCRFESGNGELGAGVYINGVDDALIDSCEFVSVATGAAPAQGLGGLPSSLTDNVAVRNCTFDGGSRGWFGGYAALLATSGVLAEGLTLLRGSNWVMDVYGYYVPTNALVQVNRATVGSGVVTMSFG